MEVLPFILRRMGTELPLHSEDVPTITEFIEEGKSSNRGSEQVCPEI